MITARGKIRDAAPTSRVMVVAILVSTVAFLDSTVVNLALPAIKRDLGGGLATQAAAIQNAVGRLSALIATACVGLIAASTLTDASFGRLLQVCAVLFFIAGAVGAIIITNPTVPAEPVSCEVAAMCRDRHDAHPHLAGHS